MLLPFFSITDKFSLCPLSKERDSVLFERRFLVWLKNVQPSAVTLLYVLAVNKKPLYIEHNFPSISIYGNLSDKGTQDSSLFFSGFHLFV